MARRNGVSRDAAAGLSPVSRNSIGQSPCGCEAECGTGWSDEPRSLVVQLVALRSRVFHDVLALRDAFRCYSICLGTSMTSNPAAVIRLAKSFASSASGTGIP